MSQRLPQADRSPSRDIQKHQLISSCYAWHMYLGLFHYASEIFYRMCVSVKSDYIFLQIMQLLLKTTFSSEKKNVTYVLKFNFLKLSSSTANFILFQKFQNFWIVLTRKMPLKFVFLSINVNHCNSYLPVPIPAVCCYFLDRDTILICDAKWMPQKAFQTCL